MELHEIKIGDKVTFKKNGKMIKGKVLHRHSGETQPHLVGHVNVVADSGKSYPITIHASKLKPALKEETQMEDNTQQLSTSDLVNTIIDGDNIAALEIFNSLMAERISDILDVQRVTMASKLFAEEKEEKESDEKESDEKESKCKECGEEMPEGKKGSYCCEECEEKGKMKKEEVELEEGGNAANKAKSRAYVKSVGTSPKSPRGWSNGHETKAEYDKRTIRAGREKLKNESVEQIDELSKKTLSSYVNKSADSKAANAMMVGNVHGRVPNVSQRPDMSPRWKKIDKRSKGIATAVSKLTKEAVIEPKSGIKTPIPAEAAAKAKEDMAKHKAKQDALLSSAKKELETSKVKVKLFAPRKEED